jgi:hypothetical protein
MEEVQALRRQLEEARDEAELNLLQLQQVQEELEFYFLRCQELDRQLSDLQGNGSSPLAPEQLPPSQQQPPSQPQPPPQAQLSAELQPPDAPDPEPQAREEVTSLREALGRSEALLQELQRQRLDEQRLLHTAQTMLEGQARYLEDVSLREEKAAQAVDRLRLLEAEIAYYIAHSRPLPSIESSRILRLIELAKQL